MSEDKNELFKALSEGDIEKIKGLLKTNPDLVHARRGWGSTPLHNVAMDGNTEIISILVSNGADINARNELGDTPLRIALKYGKWEAAAILREHGGEY